MPPKKLKLHVPAQLGAGGRFLSDNFSELPENPTDVLKGHFLHVFEVQCHKNLAVIVRKFLEYLPAVPEVHVAAANKKLDLTVRNVINKTKKFKKLTDPTELGKYSSLCNEAYPLDLASPLLHRCNSTHCTELSQALIRLT